MKEIYAWVPWFQELARKIDEGGEKYLIEKAKQVNWESNKPALLQYGDENIDPFSFFYFLAQHNTTNQRKPVYKSVSEAFGIDSQSLLSDKNPEEGFVFPTPSSNALVLFHDNANGNPNLLWELFRQAVQPDVEINPADFENALNIPNVGVAKLTQCLFLINPKYFMPVDERILRFHNVLNLPSIKKAGKGLKEPNGWGYYQELLEKFHTAFPECAVYEINTALYFMGRWKEKENITVGKRFFQISTNVSGNGKNHWEEFSQNNHVFTGRRASGVLFGNKDSDEKPYPLTEPSKGDIILVRNGTKKGLAIGIVHKNDYADEGLTDKSVIHVLWLNKSEAKFEKFTTTRNGLSEVKNNSETYKAFEAANSYKPTFELIQHTKEDNLMKHPLNQILYGPPGTGKTWDTVNYALAIIEGKSVESFENQDRKSVKKRFDELKESGQIDMVTFHQNFAYEDFIEGIRPILGNDSGDESSNLQYEIVDGVFKKIADRAHENLLQSKSDSTEIDLDALLEAYAKNIEERLAEGEEIKFLKPKKSKIYIKIDEVKRNGKFKSFTAYTHTEKSKRHPYHLTRKIIERDYGKFYNGEIKIHSDIKRPKTKSKKHSHSDFYFALYGQIKKFQDTWSPEEQRNQSVEKLDYVLIIDEINRGNIAKIFGELITLIEDTKRIGNEDETTVTLPYSSNSFGVPNNLYILGTMNTADRSIALLDTALRRRFDFIEMMPQANHSLISENVEGVNCQELLKVMNERICVLLDREHQIGHSFFIDVKSMEQLAHVFKNRIMPLLQEYFYDNWERIVLVLHKNPFIIKIEMEKNLLKNNKLVDDEREIYELRPANAKEWEEAESYQKIYAIKQTEEDSKEDDKDDGK